MEENLTNPVVTPVNQGPAVETSFALRITGKYQRFKKPAAIILLVLLGLLISIGMIALFRSWKKKLSPQPTELPTPEISNIPTAEVELSPTPTIKPTLMPTKKLITATPTTKPTSVPTTAPTSTPTQAPTSTPTPTPRVPNPPIVDISYPAEMQTVELTSSQNFCVVDTPSGGNTEGIQRKHSLNDGAWSAYTDMFTLCFDPIEGLNRLQLQYKNKYGDESAVYTRQFNFHRI